MTVTASNRAEAHALAKLLRGIYGPSWSVTIHRPLFEGDAYRITVA